MLITLFSDASLCPQSRAGGWAAWLKSDRGGVRTGGQLKQPIRDATIAEAMAAINGIVSGIIVGVIHPYDTVLIQTDCNTVLTVLTGTAHRQAKPSSKRRQGISKLELYRETRRHNKQIKAVARSYQRLIDYYCIDIKWRHVKGHRGSSDNRAAVNTLCDKSARQHMREARKTQSHAIPSVTLLQKAA